LLEAPLRHFLDVLATKTSDPKWKDWTFESSIQMDISNIIVKFWTGRIPDHDVETYLKRYGNIISKYKPVDKLGIWYGVRKYKIKMNRNSDGEILNLPNSISLGPYNGRIIYPGQSVTCFICNSADHQVRKCTTVKCWRCNELGHKAKDCDSDSLCNLCGKIGHNFFNCPSSYVNKAKTQQQPRPAAQKQPGPPSVTQQQPGPPSVTQHQPRPAAQQQPGPGPSAQQPGPGPRPAAQQQPGPGPSAQQPGPGPRPAAQQQPGPRPSA